MDGPPPPEEDFSQLPILDRLAHKNWKARVSGYETLSKTFQTTASDSDPAFKPYLSNPDTLKKIVTDSNAVAQEKGVESVVNFVKFAGENAARTREVVIPALVDKCFGSSRAGTKQQAIELVLQYIEVENGAAGVVNDIVPGLAAKQPKAVLGTVSALKEAFRVFGAHVVPPPPVLKTLPKIFAHTDKNVRAEGTALVQCLYQAIGPAIEPWLAELKPVQIKELKESFEKMDAEGTGKGTLKPERFTRATAREMETGGGETEAEAAQEDPATMDPRAFAEEIDISSKIPSGFHGALASSKWKDRKEALDELLAVLNSVPRIKDSPDISEVVKALAGRMSDANINCVLTAANCLEALAKAEMSSFARYRETAVPPMLEKMKERKQNVTDAIGNALDAIFSTVTLPEILENILPPLGSKNPQVKEGTLKFLTRCLSTSTTPPTAPQVKPLSEALSGLLEDSFEGARNEAATSLGTLMKIVGERPLNAVMDQLADVRKVKVKEAFDKATVKCKAGSGPAPRSAPSAKPASAPVKKASTAHPSKPAVPAVEDSLMNDIAPPMVRAKPPARFVAKKSTVEPDEDASAPASAEAPKAAPKPPARLMQAKKPAPSAAAAAAATAASSKPGKAALPTATGSLDTFKFKHSPEDAEVLAANAIPAELAAGLGDSNWKARLAALEEMTAWMQDAAESIDSEVVTRFLIKKGGAEKNFQVSAKLYGVLSIMAERSASFGRSSVALAAPHLSEKLGDMKLKKPAGDALLLFAEKTSLQFVLNQAYDTVTKQKAPKVLADSVAWIESALKEFGVAGVSLRALIDFLKSALGNSNAAVRTAATKALVTIKVFVGPSVKDLLGEINPQLQATISSEFDKVEGEQAPEPARISVDVQAMGTAASGKGGAASSAAMDDLFPRVELDGLMKGTTILSGAKNDSWKAKKEALEALQAILDQGPNKRLKPSMGEIGQILKSRVTDTNKAVQILALDIVSRIATGMGRPFEKHTRFFALPVATVLSDQKTNIRQAALATLTAIAEACEGVDSLVHGFATALESANPLQRSTLLNWIADWFKAHEPEMSLDLSTWAAPIVQCLDDRSADVRKNAQAALPFVVAQAGFDYVMQQTNSLKPASRATVAPLVKAAAAAAPERPGQAEKVEKAEKPIEKAKKAPGPPAPIKIAEPAAAAVMSPPQSPMAAAPQATGLATTRIGGVRRKLPQGSIPRPDSRASAAEDNAPPPTRLATKSLIGGLKRPMSYAPKPVVATAPAQIADANVPFTSARLQAKESRLTKDGTKWVVEGGPIRKEVIDQLQAQMEPFVSKDAFALLFSHDHNASNDHISGLTALCDFYSSLANGDDKYGFSAQEKHDFGIANMDLSLKYVSIRVHEPQPNLIGKCLDLVEAVMAFLRDVNYQLTDAEALCFVPSVINKLGDAREAVRVRVQLIIQTLPKVFAFSRVFQLLMEYGLRSKVAKTRQGTLDEMAGILKRTGIGACEPSKAFPVMASMISDKDAAVRKSALSALGEAYVLIGESIWSQVGPLSAKDKTQLEERLRRVAGPSNVETAEPPTSQAASVSPVPGSRIASVVPRPSSRVGGASVTSRLPNPSSPSRRPASDASASAVRSGSPTPSSRLPKSGIPSTLSPSTRQKSALPSRFGASRIGAPSSFGAAAHREEATVPDRPAFRQLNGESHQHTASVATTATEADTVFSDDAERDDVSLAISKILSSDPSRSVDALKQIQRILEAGLEDDSSKQYQDLSDHTEGLMETIALQMSHVFEDGSTITAPENFRLAKHLIQTINAFCDHPLLAESVQVENLTGLFEELTLRLLQTDESDSSKVKDLSRFINMIILRLFSTCRRMTVIRSLFTLLLQIVKPFPKNGTAADSREAKVAELVLKCIWKLARSIPADLEKRELDPVELFPAIESFLQSIPPNEWRARATNKVPSGDMPLRTIKVIIQHVVAFYADEVYDFLSTSFDDPSATIVYPYVYRILNTSRNGVENGGQRQPTNGSGSNGTERSESSPIGSQPTSPRARSSVASNDRYQSSSRHTSHSGLSTHDGNGLPPPVDEPDPDEQLLTIINHISSEVTGAMHKEGITELHQFIKAYPHKKPRVDRMLENTGPAFRKYIARALASRAAEDEERNVAVADTLSRLETNGQFGSTSARNSAVAQTPLSPTRSVFSEASTSASAPRRESAFSNGSSVGQVGDV